MEFSGGAIMRKTLISILSLCIILTMSNCKEDEDDPITPPEFIKPTVNPFIGTWKSIASGYHDVFTENTITVYKTDKSIYWKATYTYDDTNVTVKLDTTISDSKLIDDWGDTALLPYIFNDEYLYLNEVQLEKCDYDFIP